MRQLGSFCLLALLCACGRQAPDSPATVGGPGTDAGSPQPEPSDGGGVAPAPQIDPYKELVIVDSTVVLDGRTSNETGRAWSFRHAFEQLTPLGSSPSARAESWLRSFRASEVAGRAVDDRPGVEPLLAAWPRAHDGSLDLGRAPFRLVAIASRLDIATSPNGEARLIYGLVDPVSGEPGLMTVAFEYSLPPLGTANDRQAWAARWHGLASHPFGAEY